MLGKNKCKILKQIRAEIAAQNNIEWVTSECKYQGDCKGTCPKCESEVRKLEKALEQKRKLGEAVAVVGIVAGMSLTVGACTNTQQEPNPTSGYSGFQKESEKDRDDNYAGDIEYVTETEETSETERSSETEGTSETEGIPETERDESVPLMVDEDDIVGGLQEKPDYIKD